MHFKYLLITQIFILFFICFSIDRSIRCSLFFKLIQLRSIDFCVNYLLLPHSKHFAFCFIFVLCCFSFKLIIIISFNMLCSVLCFCALIAPHNKRSFSRANELKTQPYILYTSILLTYSIRNRTEATIR